MFVKWFITFRYVSTLCVCAFLGQQTISHLRCEDNPAQINQTQTHLWRRALQQRWWRPLHHSATAALTFSWGNSNWISHSGEETLPERTAPQISCQLVLLWRCSNRNQDQRLMVTVPQQHMHPQTSYYITTALQQEGHWFKSWQKLLVFLFTVNIFLTFPNNSVFIKLIQTQLYQK